MGDFISGMIRLILKMIVLLVVVYVGFVVVTIILDDIDRRFLSDDEDESEQTELVEEKDVDEVDVVEPKLEPALAFKKSTTTKKKNNGPATIFDEPRDCVTSKSLKVEDIFESKYVVAKELFEGLEEYGATTDLTVVFIDNNNTYYTDQVITIPRGKCVRQIGVYKSTHYLYNDKTLPIVKIMNE